MNDIAKVWRAAPLWQKLFLAVVGALGGVSWVVIGLAKSSSQHGGPVILEAPEPRTESVAATEASRPRALARPSEQEPALRPSRPPTPTLDSLTDDQREVLILTLEALHTSDSSSLEDYASRDLSALPRHTLVDYIYGEQLRSVERILADTHPGSTKRRQLLYSAMRGAPVWYSTAMASTHRFTNNNHGARVLMGMLGNVTLEQAWRIQREFGPGKTIDVLHDAVRELRSVAEP